MISQLEPEHKMSITCNSSRIVDIPLVDILSDDTFNCRGPVAPFDVIELGRDIQARGLDFPIVVQPWNQTLGKKYRIIAGHRRFMAFRVIKSQTIPCTVRTDLDEFGAAGLNLRENVQRKQLNIAQEAHGLRKFVMAGWSENDIAMFLQQSRGWVQVRTMVLKLPEDIQQEIAAGLVDQTAIRKMNGMRQPEQYALLRAIKDDKYKAREIEIPDEKKPNPNKVTKRSRDRLFIFGMIDHLLSTIKSGLHTRCLAWAAGEISDVDLHTDIAKYCKENGIEYTIPEHVLEAMKENQRGNNP